MDKKIKLIAIDIDDTLLNDEKEIPKENIDAIKKVKGEGINVILASGRPFSLVTENLYRELGLTAKGNYYVGYNGESVYDIYTKECLFSNSLNEDDIFYLESKFNNLNKQIARYVHLDDKVVVINPNKYSYIEYEYNQKEYQVGDFNLIKKIKAHKYQLAGSPDIINEIFNNLPDCIKQKYSVVISMPCFIEFMKNGVDKYQGIMTVCEILGINKENIMTIGDSMNDYFMIKNAQYGVAMKNANENVKKIAKLITTSNNDGGVSVAINSVLTIR